MSVALQVCSFFELNILAKACLPLGLYCHCVVKVNDLKKISLHSCADILYNLKVFVNSRKYFSLKS